MIRPRLLLFVRAPRLGQGKRRLARELGDIAALRFERLMIARLLRRLGRDPRWTIRIAVTPDEASRYPGKWLRQIEVVAQGSGDLGMRMQRAITAAPPGPVVLIGSDIPGIEGRHIAAAFHLLGQHDLVFGPAADGGFWLIGARRRTRLPTLFGTVRWSSPHALGDALAGLPRRFKVGIVATLEDVDDADSFRRLAPQRGF